MARAGMRASGRQGGVTVIELMVVIAIVGVLAAVAIPAFDSIIKNNRRATVANELLASLMSARGESTKRGQTVRVCGTVDGAACANDGNWDKGWLVYADADGDATLDAGELIRRFVNDYPITVRSSAGALMSFPPFQRSVTAGNLTICDQRKVAYARVVVVERTGRARVAEKLGDGNAPTCP